MTEFEGQPVQFKGQPVQITGIKMTFNEMVNFIVKWFFASIVAAIVVCISMVLPVMFLYRAAAFFGFG